MDQISEVLRRTAPPALAPSSVTLEVMSMPPVTHESLATAVESAFGRRCTISSSDNNLDLGLEAACTTPETAVVGGPGGAEYGHLIVGANPVGIDLTWAAAGGESLDATSPVTFLTIGTPRQIRRTEVSVNGYDWTIPLAAALWNPNTKSATIDEERVTLMSAEELLAWKNARAASNN